MQESVNFANLKKMLQDGLPLVLFLGSGVSAEFVPTWEPLINELIYLSVDHGLGNRNRQDREKIKKILIRNDKHKWSPYEKATLIKRFLGDQYIQYLSDCLYKNVPNKNLEKIGPTDASLFNATVSLCNHLQIHAVVTYNFDNLLDIAIRKKPAHSVYGKKQIQSNIDGIPIYHVHGYIPFGGPLPSKDDANIVFSQEEYFQSMHEPMSWQISTQLYLLRNYVCLFIGLSLTDLNILRILSQARYYQTNIGKIFILVCQQSIIEQSSDHFHNAHDLDLVMQIWSTLMDQVGAKIIIAGEKFDQIKNYVLELNKFLA